MSEPVKLLIAVAAIGAAAVYMVNNHLDPSKRPAPAPQLIARPQPAPVAAPAPVLAARATGGRMELPADRNGQFVSPTEIDGRRIDMLVDTGATFVSLSHQDAETLGIRPFPNDYKVPVATASGELRAARVTLRTVAIGSISARDVPALVLPKGAGSTSLLGMSFLQRLGGFEISGGKLLLRP